MLVKTLKRSAGQVSFSPDRIVDLPDELIPELLEAGAIELIERSSSVVVESTFDDVTSIEVKDDSGNVAVSDKPKRKRR